MSLTRRQLLMTMTAASAGALVGCSRDDDGPGASTPSATSAQTTTPTPTDSTTSGRDVTRLRIEDDVADGLNVPWGLAFLPDGTALVTERDDARVVRVGDGRTRTVGEVPGVEGSSGAGEGGLLGIVLTPERDAVIVMASTADDNRILALPFDGSRLGAPRVLLDGIPRAVHHNGGRLVIGPDRMLYASTGDAGERERAQDTDDLAGKILRMTLDGRPAAQNPFGNRVWSYGHRNVEGLAFDADGRLWAAEFGDKSYDELNLVERGKNYGWPQTEGPTDESGITGPKAWWPTDEASPAGVGVVPGAAYLGALQGECVWVVPLDGADAGKPVRRLGDEGLGRIRNAVPAPDGTLWVTTSNTDGRARPGRRDDRIVRVRIG